MNLLQRFFDTQSGDILFDNIPIKNYNITGISGGAWCSLLYTQETDLSNHDTIWDYSIGKDVSRICIHNDMRVFQNNVDKNMKLRYSNKEPLNLDKISIISTNINKVSKDIKVIIKILITLHIVLLWAYFDKYLERYPIK